LTTSSIDTATFDTVIVAHTSRSLWASDLAHQTNAHLSIDNGRLGCTQNHLAAWEHHSKFTSADWSVILEDDAMPIPDFLAQTGLALAAAPTDIVSLYLGRQRPPQYQTAIAAAVKRAARTNDAWITAPNLFHAVGVAIRTPLLSGMLRHVSHIHTGLDIDEAITEWAKYHGRLIGYTMPSLVDHRDQGTIAHHRDYAPREPGRVAYKTGTRETWDSTVTMIEVL
jgi:GR25 family glycosyltransferase involved in LPS biosynthesis